MPLLYHFHINNEELSYLLGALYGDGCLTRDGKVFFGVTDKEFVECVVTIIGRIFNLDLNIRRRKLSQKNKNWKDVFEFSSRRLYRLLIKLNIKNFTKIPNFITKGNQKIKAAFIRGFFDAEGNIDIRKIKRKDGRTDTIRHLKCFSNNKILLYEILQLLEQLKIKSKIFRGKGKNFCVCIWNYKSLKNFNDRIGFVIKRKQLKLEKALSSYKEIQIQWDYSTYEKVIQIRKSQKIGAHKIQQKLSKIGINISKPTIESWIYGRTKITAE